MHINKLSIFIATLCSTVAIGANASSHREAPNLTRMPKVDATDFYAFNSYEPGRSDYVTLIANYLPLQDAFGGPNYFALDPDAVYSIHIDNDGDAKEDITFQFRFSNDLPAEGEGVALEVGPEGDTKSIPVPLKNLGAISASDMSKANFSESYTLTLVDGDRRTGSAMKIANANGGDRFSKPLDYIGDKTFGSASGYEDYADSFIHSISIPGCSEPGKVFVGQRKDPFVVNLGKTFDLVNYVPIEGDSAPGAGDGEGFPNGITQSASNDALKDKNVTELAIEVPKSCVTGSGNGVIGAWTTASLPQARIINPDATFKKPEVSGGAMTQVSRLGNPLVNELVIGLKDKDKFNASEPKNDAQFAKYVTNPSLPELLNILFKKPVNDITGANFKTLAPTNFPRTDLMAAFLTGVKGVNQLKTVTPSEMLRLNTGIAAVAANQQSTFGVAGDDLAGFPNGRRPGDDVVDIALRVMMGALCYKIPVDGTPTNLGFCQPADASVGNQPFTDGAPINASMMKTSFPYLAEPISGSK